MSEAAVDAQRDMEREASAIQAFVEDTLIIEADAWMPTYELYDQYRAWCIDNGTQPLPSNKFAPKLRALRPKLIRASKKADPKDGKRVPGYTGLRLANPPPSYAEYMTAGLAVLEVDAAGYEAGSCAPVLPDAGSVGSVVF